MQIQKSSVISQLMTFLEISFPNGLRHGDFTGLRRLMGSPCTLYTVTLIDAMRKTIFYRSKCEIYGWRFEGMVQSKVGRSEDGGYPLAPCWLSTPNFCSFVVEFCYSQTQTFCQSILSILHVTPQDVPKYFLPLHFF